MKVWLSLTWFLTVCAVSWAQMALMQMPSRVTWVEDFSHRSARGEVTRACSVNSTEGDQWRSEVATDAADISIAICKGGKVTATGNATPEMKAGPGGRLEEIYEAITGRAKFEIVDIMGGVGYSRYREVRAGSLTRIIWMDRATGFPRRISTTFADGATREEYFRIIEVDISTRRRLFDANTLYPFFAQYLDEWHARLKR